MSPEVTLKSSEATTSPLADITNKLSSWRWDYIVCVLVHPHVTFQASCGFAHLVTYLTLVDKQSVIVDWDACSVNPSM